MGDPVARGLGCFFAFDNSFEARNRLHFSGSIECEFDDFSFEFLVLLLGRLRRGIECVGADIGGGFFIRGPKANAARFCAGDWPSGGKNFHADGGVPGDRQAGRALRVRGETRLRGVRGASQIPSHIEIPGQENIAGKEKRGAKPGRSVFHAPGATF